MTDGRDIPRTPTGISGFLQVSLGGLPAGRATLVTGTTGSGKTLFALEFLARGIANFDEPGVFVTFEETADDIRRNAASFGFDIAVWEAEGKWAFVDVSSTTIGEPIIIGSYDFSALIARVGDAVRRIGARRVSIDSLGAIFTRFPDLAVVRREVLRLVGSLEQLQVTAIVTAERATEHDGVSRYGVEEFAVDNVIVLRNNLQAERRRRTIEIVKFRGAAHRTGEWLFTIDPRDGMVVIPLAFLVPRDRAAETKVSTGNPELDEMCGGGVYRDGVILLTGPTGMGKTLSALRFVAAGTAAGERCLLYSFDETREQLSRNAGTWGLDLASMERSGQLRVICEYPEVASLEDHFLRLHRALEEFHPHRLVIDTLSALERIVTPRGLLDFVLALVGLLRQREVTTLLTAAPVGRTTSTITPAIATEIASLVDTSIVLRYVEAPGRIMRVITVIQTRGSAHDDSVREVTVDHDGLHIGPPARALTQVLTGSPFNPPGFAYGVGPEPEDGLGERHDG
ncbi:circadian clock protein KaiC [Actinoplanes ianthinogenes]|uniref:non-specific serine/threonine protein kinase n=1 Tax=Actinoplanes ianthinogenes TaxID=122358 RepID=A0ABM7M7T8_9ACTN|nr:circadian clock protein KaiC [Actinoplanes ianthinogenes]BCJ47730.1 circadian clock protein KaiC [Actinoplanes ianthinogenes]GGR03772.1 circadian clock protein KaiC [Actinoplanes ianthinogenes]